MKFFILFIALFTMPFFLFSQTLDIDWGEKYGIKGSGKTELLTIENDGYYVVFGMNNFKGNVRVLKYNFQNKVLSEETHKFEYSERRLSLRKIIKIDSRIYGILSYNEWDRNTFISEFENGHFGRIGKWFEHDFDRRGKFLSSEQSYQDLEHSISKSPNGSSLVYASSIRKYDKYRPEEFLVAVFDNQMNLKWEKKEALEYYDTSFFTDKVTVDDNGENVFLIGFISKKRQKDAYKIFHITQDNTQEYSINLKDKYHPTSVFIFYDQEKEELVITGIYKAYNKKYQAGIFYQELDLVTSKFSKVKYEPFAQKDQLEHRYSITEFRELSNGNYQFLASSRKCLLDGKSGMSAPERNNEKLRDEEWPTHCFCNQIIFWITDKQGNFIKRNIYDREIKMAYNTVGYTLLSDGDSTYLFFVMDGKKDKKAKLNRNNFDLKLLHIDAQGNVISDKIILQSKNMEYLIEDILAFFHEEKIIFGGRIQKFNQSIFYGKKYFIFGNVKVEDYD